MEAWRREDREREGEEEEAVAKVTSFPRPQGFFALSFHRFGKGIPKGNRDHRDTEK